MSQTKAIESYKQSQNQRNISTTRREDSKGGMQNPRKLTSKPLSLSLFYSDRDLCVYNAGAGIEVMGPVGSWDDQWPTS